MAENTKVGREPIAKVTINQDFCSRSYGDGNCRGGLTNILANSQDMSDVNSWTYSATDWSITQSGTASGDGLALATVNVFEKLTPGGDYFFYADLQDRPIDGDIYYTIYFDGVALVDEFFVQVYLNSGRADIKIDLSDGSYVNGFAWTAFDSVTIDTLSGSQHFKISLKVNAANEPTSKISFFALNSSTAPTTGAEFNIYGVMGTSVESQNYVETSGNPIIATSVEPCFNTRKTCQDSSSYDLTTLPLKFVKSRAPIPNDDYYLPCLESVSISPAQLNPGGANKSSSPFGTRATISATFRDFPHNDKLVDNYTDQRSYDPFTRGTFWTKWAARNPYYMHRLIEHESGYLLNGAIIEPIKRTFVITSFDGVDSNGNVKISGKDLLTLAENNKAQAPRASSGALNADILAAATTFDVKPSGVGDIEYPTSGFVRIEKEIMSFTRVTDTFTVVRGYGATDAEDHSEDSTVQLCLEYDAQLPADITYDLLLNYANIPAGYLDKANWDIEGGAYLPRLYTALITEPTGVSTLIGEMCEQMYFTIWWDERDNLVKLRAVRSPQDDTIYDLTDDANFIKDSVAWGDLPDQLVTQVNVYYNQVNPTLKLDDASNYAAVETYLNLDASSANKHGINKIKTIYSRWITSTATAQDLATKIANRFGEIPKQITFRLDAKDSFLWLGDFVRMQNRLLVDTFGAPRLANMQIFSANESKTGTEYSYRANEFFITEPEDPNALEVIIGTNILNVNLRSLFDDEYGITLTGSEVINFRVRSGVVIGGDTCGGGANVLEAARTDANDFYLGGPWRGSSNEIGLLPVLQKNDISVVTTTAADAIYRLHPGELGARAEWIIKEYPISLALETGSFPVGTTVNLIIESGAYIIGEGGNGLAHSLYSPFNYFVPAGDGGDALKIDYPINIYNNGIIAGGGGGGASQSMFMTAGAIFVVTGGGGAGSLQSRVRSELRINNTSTFTGSSSGGYLTGGTGGTGKIGSTTVNYVGTAKGFGGDLATVGQKITYSTGTPTEYGIGGQPGAAIRSGKNDITWLLKGDVRGAENV